MNNCRLEMSGEQKNQMLSKIIEHYPDEKMILIADGFDDAVIGLDVDSMRLIYSVKKTLEILFDDFKENNPDENDDDIMVMAQEYFDYNVRGAKGENFPIWCDDLFF